MRIETAQPLDIPSTRSVFGALAAAVRSNPHGYETSVGHRALPLRSCAVGRLCQLRGFTRFELCDIGLEWGCPPGRKASGSGETAVTHATGKLYTSYELKVSPLLVRGTEHSNLN